MTDSTEFPKEQIEAFRRAAKRQRQLWEAIEVLRDEARGGSGLELLYGDPERDTLRNAIRTVLREIDAPRSVGNLAITLTRPPGRPRKYSLITRDAVRLHKEGQSHARIAKFLNQKHGEGTATRESVRKLIKRHERAER